MRQGGKPHRIVISGVSVIVSPPRLVVASPGRLLSTVGRGALELLRSVKRSITFAYRWRSSGGVITMEEIEAFVDECRADTWFQGHPEVVDRLESVLTKFYLVGEGPEWQVIWDQVHAVLKRTTDTLVDRCQALAAVLQDVRG
jgi:hypothetical protein